MLNFVLSLFFWSFPYFLCAILSNSAKSLFSLFFIHIFPLFDFEGLTHMNVAQQYCSGQSVLSKKLVPQRKGCKAAREWEKSVPLLCRA